MSLLDDIEPSDLNLDREEREEWSSPLSRSRNIQRIRGRLTVSHTEVETIDEVNIPGPMSVTDLDDNKIADESEAAIYVSGFASASLGYGSLTAAVSKTLYVEIGLTFGFSGPSQIPKGIVTFWP